MKNQSDDILDNLTFVNGKEEVEEITASKKKATKKIAKKEVEKTEQPSKPLYSYEDLVNRSSTDLTNICAQVGVPAPRRKPQMIQNILNA